MAVQITNETNAGELYINEHGEVYQIQSFCMSPTVTMESMVTGSLTGGAIGCLNLETFKPLEELTREELLAISEGLARGVRASLDERIKLREEIVDLKERLFKVKYPADSSF